MFCYGDYDSFVYFEATYVIGEVSYMRRVIGVAIGWSITSPAKNKRGLLL